MRLPTGKVLSGFLAVGAALLLASLSSIARGQSMQSTTLDALLPGGAQSGGILIDGWRYSDFTFRQEGAVNVAPSTIDVVVRNRGASIEDRLDDIQFSFATDAPTTLTGKLFLDYRIDAATYRLNRAGLRFNGFIPSQGSGGGAVRIVENVFRPDGGDVSPGSPVSPTEILDVFNDGPGRLEDSNADFLSLNGTPILQLSKEITLTGSGAGPFQVRFVDTFFAFPEPAFAAAALPAALGLLMRRRRPARRRAPVN